MKNPKKVGTDYERKIIDIINEYLGSGYTRTKYSGGGDHKGDMREYYKTTPLARYTIECKYHGSDREFRRKILLDIDQAVRQTPANRNWQLIIHWPNSQTELVIMDLKDYLVNDILGQMITDNQELKNITGKIKTGLRMLRVNVDKLISKL